jgi:methyl-accepting chemotaxis protein
VFSVRELGAVNHTAYQLGNDLMPGVNAAMGIKERMSRLRTQEMQIVLSAGDQASIDKYFQHWKEYAEQLHAYQKDFSEFAGVRRRKQLLGPCAKLMDAVRRTDRQDCCTGTYR